MQWCEGAVWLPPNIFGEVDWDFDMNKKNQSGKYIVDVQNLPKQFPTHRHTPEFWEELGRTVATFGFLEEVLGKAIFSFTATRKYARNEIDAAFEKWTPLLERALSDALGSLIVSFEKSVRENKDAKIEHLDVLIKDLQKASAIRNVLCHGSWRPPNEAGESAPSFVNRKNQVFTTKIDISYLQQVQRHVAELACAVISTVTLTGIQFPGSNGPGKSIFDS